MCTIPSEILHRFVLHKRQNLFLPRCLSSVHSATSNFITKRQLQWTVRHIGGSRALSTQSRVVTKGGKKSNQTIDHCLSYHRKSIKVSKHTKNRIGTKRRKKNQTNQLTIAAVIMEEAERGTKKIESAVVMVTVSAINIVGRRKRNHRKKQNQATQPMDHRFSYHWTGRKRQKKYNQHCSCSWSQPWRAIAGDVDTLNELGVTWPN